jgi:FlaA1/EpsC-like NDP-sugar epimerase
MEVRDFFKQMGIPENELKYDKFYSLEEICLKKQKEGKKIVIWGAGIAGRKLMKFLIHRGVKISYFADNDSKRWGSFLEGIEIMGNKPDKNCFVLISTMYEKEVALQLKSYSVEFAGAYADSFFSYPVNMSLVEKNLDSLINKYFELNVTEKRIFASIYLYLLNRDILQVNKLFNRNADSFLDLCSLE